MLLNPNVTGSTHGSKKGEEMTRCSDLYKNLTFQEVFKEKLPVLDILDRLYKVGVEVNRFQQKELQQCQ
jgi:hypothetical protein